MSNSGTPLSTKLPHPPHGQEAHSIPSEQKGPLSQSTSLPYTGHSVAPAGQFSQNELYHNQSPLSPPGPTNMQRSQYQPGPPLPGQSQMPQSQMPPGPPQNQFNSMMMANQKNLGSSPLPNAQSQHYLGSPPMPGQQKLPPVNPQNSQNMQPQQSLMMNPQNMPAPPSLQNQGNYPNAPISNPMMTGPPMAQPHKIGTPPSIHNPMLPGQQNMMRPQTTGSPNMPSLGQPQNNMMGLPQNSLSRPPMPGQENSNSGPTLISHHQPTSLQNSMAGLSLSGPPLPGQQNNLPPQGGMPGQQNNLPPQGMPGPHNNLPPLPGQQNNLPPQGGMPGQQNNLPPQGMPGQTGGLPGQQNNLYGSSLSGPPLPGQQNNMMHGQPSLSGPPLPGQQNMPGRMNLPGQHNLQPHLSASQNQMAPPTQGYPQSQIPGQRHQYPGGGLAGPVPGQVMGNPALARQPGMQAYPQQQQQYHGQQQNMLGSQGYPQPGMGPPQQRNRLDPEQMPSPIQVIQDDQRIRSGDFITNQKGVIPPLVTTKFTVQDQGNASPRYIRSTMYTVPTTIDIMKLCHVPFGLILSPMARAEPGEYEPMIVNMGEIGPVRCIRCKAYMCPYMQFIDAGKRFQCMFCKATTEVPQEYFQHLDHTGQRMDRHERPELMLGTYEYIATKEYCRDNTFPKPPALVFVIDVSYNNIKSGLVNLICGRMKEIIRNLPVDVGQEKSNMKVGFITYNNTVHFYNIKSCLAQPQMLIVGDVQDMFMPLLDGFLCDPEESEVVIDSLMAQIPTMFADTRETETILAPAIQAGLEALKAAGTTGKLMVFHSSLPIAEAPGKLKNRDDRKLLGTDKEKNVLAPQNSVYNSLGQDCVGAGCSVDLFVFNNSFVDIATIGQVCRLTGGEVYKYTYFQADVDGDRFITDVVNNIRRPIAFDSVMRIRTSTGVRATDFFGHFYMSNATDMDIASIDCDKAVAVEIKHDDKLTEDEGVYIQVALLYTSCSGIRRLRIINLSLKTSSQLSELYRACELDAIINFFSKESIFKLIQSTPTSVKDYLITRCARMLAAYRKNCASPSSSGQLILPECMKLLPLYINCLLKSDALSGGPDMAIDDRAFVMQAVCTMTVKASVTYFYPRLIPLHDVNIEETGIPPMIRCSNFKISKDGAYLLENGIHMFLWMGLALNPMWVQSVFGSASVAHIDTSHTTIPILDNPLNRRIQDIINSIRQERHYSMRLTLVREGDKLEPIMRHFLVEDRGNDGSSTYVDFLCHMHKEIRSLLS